MTAKFGDLEAENTKLRADVKELKVQVSKPNQELLLIKGQNSILESHLSSNRVTYETNQTSKKNENEPSSRGLSGLPSSCKELKAGYTSVPMDGIHLVKRTNKINAVFCTFPMGIGKMNWFLFFIIMNLIVALVIRHWRVFNHFFTRVKVYIINYKIREFDLSLIGFYYYFAHLTGFPSLIYKY